MKLNGSTELQEGMTNVGMEAHCSSWQGWTTHLGTLCALRLERGETERGQRGACNPAWFQETVSAVNKMFFAPYSHQYLDHPRISDIIKLYTFCQINVCEISHNNSVILVRLRCMHMFFSHLLPFLRNVSLSLFLDDS